jgi:exodeoxyribonuclease VII large subunit
VARAIRASGVPIVSGIGHEIDFTIADFVADARAPTPSGAAELVVPDRNACLDALARTMGRLSACMRRELRSVTSSFEAANARLKLTHPGIRLNQQVQRLDELEQRLVSAVARELRAKNAKFDGVSLRLKASHPGVRLTQQAQRLQDLQQRLNGAMRGSLHSDARRISEMFTRLVHQSPAHAVQQNSHRHSALATRLDNAAKQSVSRAAHRLELAVRSLNTVSPLATLSRGFAVVNRTSDGALVTDAESVGVGDEIKARLAHGTLKAVVTGKE